MLLLLFLIFVVIASICCCKWYLSSLMLVSAIVVAAAVDVTAAMKDCYCCCLCCCYCCNTSDCCWDCCCCCCCCCSTQNRFYSNFVDLFSLKMFQRKMFFWRSLERQESHSAPFRRVRGSVRTVGRLFYSHIVNQAPSGSASPSCSLSRFAIARFFSLLAKHNTFRLAIEGSTY